MSYIVLNDLKVEDASRGAALTMSSYLDAAPEEIAWYRSREFQQFMVDPEEDILILGNTTQLDPVKGMWIINNCRYIKVNFDVNWCAIRNPMIHDLAYKNIVSYEGELGDFLRQSKCNCYQQIGNLQADIIRGAELNCFMSYQQMKITQDKFKKIKSIVTHSAFDKCSLNNFKQLQGTIKNNKALIWGAPDYIKGKENGVEWCKKNNVEYDLVSGIKHKELLGIMAGYKYLVFLPNASDSAPRLTIEAKMLGCETILNENCQHIGEEWWDYDFDNMFDFLENVPQNFWKEIKKIHKSKGTNDFYHRLL